MEALISTLFLFSGKRMIHLKLKFKDNIKKRKTVILPVYAFDKDNFIIILPTYNENGELIDIIKLNLPIQVVANPSKELYRFLRIRGVI